MDEWERGMRATFAGTGSIIMQRHKHAKPRRILAFHLGDHVIAKDLDTNRRSRISWKTLFRYDCVYPRHGSPHET